ncbi:hypothetical protein DRO59_03150 [Candidatus Bathyarchaeota archaeon]|nr:MAG: hypothetical protein DRO59_03150 [Candidatus Bathyarchaeota archaeon]
MKMLTKVLQDRCGTEVRRISIPYGRGRFVWVEPNHYNFWRRFKTLFPNWCSNAKKNHAVSTESVCPEFDQVEDLISWLVETMGLPNGFRKLLMLEVVSRECCW